MILSDRDIKQAIKEGRIKIDPKPNYSEQLGSCSIDLRLGSKFRVFTRSRHPFLDVKVKISIDPKQAEELKKNQEEALKNAEARKKAAAEAKASGITETVVELTEEQRLKAEVDKLLRS